MPTKKELKEAYKAQREALKREMQEKLDAMPKGRAGEVTEKTYEFATATIGRFLRRLGYDWTFAEVQRQAKELGLIATKEPVKAEEPKAQKEAKKK